jgi:pimeloyl-ACP methyl ester carboxylesterase
LATRRDVMAMGLGASILTANAETIRAQTAQKTFVLVHGAWGGGWVWRRVSDLLERRGHKVFTPTMTGVGERSHLLDAKVNLSTHITDIVNVIKWERIENAVLVGHSYGGMVITGVAEQIGRAIGSIVFLDAFLPENGQALIDIAPQGPVRAAVENHDLTVASPPAEFFAVNEKDRSWVDTLSTPHPTATMTEAVKDTGARERISRKAYVLATGRRSPFFSAAYAKIQSASGWRSYEAPCGHFVMIDMPERLVEILLEA